MEPWFEEQLQMLLLSKDQDDFTAGITKAIERLEFEYYSYGLRVAVPITQPRYELRNNYPLEWQVHYEKQGYLEKDPTVLHGIKSNIPIVWEESLFEGARELWEEANSHGLIERVGAVG